jgi:hypothetical protein
MKDAEGERLFAAVADALMTEFIRGEQQCDILVPLALEMLSQGWRASAATTSMNTYTAMGTEGVWIAYSLKQAMIQHKEISEQEHEDEATAVVTARSGNYAPRNPVLPERRPAGVAGSRPVGDRRTSRRNDPNGR